MSRELVDKILPHLHGRPVCRVLELGGRRPWLERRFNTISVYNAFDEKPEVAGVLKHDLAEPLSLPDSSHDLALALGLFERLPMDQLYMVASETRRIVQPGGLWILSGLSTNENFLRQCLGGILCKVKRRKALELTHYISPEDWKTLENAKWNEGLLTHQLLVLERLS